MAAPKISQAEGDEVIQAFTEEYLKRLVAAHVCVGEEQTMLAGEKEFIHEGVAYSAKVVAQVDRVTRPDDAVVN
jgi:hypothetical protein